jgi:hypothetical protein
MKREMTRKEIVEEALRENPKWREIYNQWPLPPWELKVRISEGLVQLAKDNPDGVRLAVSADGVVRMEKARVVR